MDEYIGLDLGTSNLKGVLVRGNTIVAREVRSNSFLYPEEGHVEIDPERYFASVYDLVGALAAKSHGPVKGIAGCAASGNTLLMDEDARSCSNIISWLDQRKVQRPDFAPDRIHEIVGWPLINTFPLVHLQDFKEKGMLKGKHIGMSNDYVWKRLTGNHVLDYSSGTPFYLIDQKRKCYCKEILSSYGITEEQLPRLAESSSCIGTLLPEYRQGNLTEETTVFCGSFDHPAAARAVNLLKEDEILLSCGSSWVVFEALEKREVLPGTLTDPYLSGSGGPWGRMRSLAKAGLDLEEFICSTFGNTPRRYELLQQNAERSDVLSYLKGLAERFIAILPRRKIRTIYMVGGAAKSPLCPSMLARMSHCPVLVPEFHLFAGSVGASRMAGAESVPLNCHVYNP